MVKSVLIPNELLVLFRGCFAVHDLQRLDLSAHFQCDVKGCASILTQMKRIGHKRMQM